MVKHKKQETKGEGFCFGSLHHLDKPFSAVLVFLLHLSSLLFSRYAKKD